MSTATYKYGWAKTPDGDLFAPITTTNEVLTTDGQDLSMKLEQIQSDIDSKKIKSETNGNSKAYLAGVKSTTPTTAVDTIAFNNNVYIDEQGRLCADSIRIGDAIISWDIINQRLITMHIDNIGG